MEKNTFDVVSAIRSAIQYEIEEIIQSPNYAELIYPMDLNELYDLDGRLSVEDVKLAASTAVLLAYHKVDRILLQLQLYND